jgi:hypothetical protein
VDVLLRHICSEPKCGISLRCDFRSYVGNPSRFVVIAHVNEMATPTRQGATRVVLAILDEGYVPLEQARREEANGLDKSGWKQFTAEVNEYTTKLRASNMQQDASAGEGGEGKTIYAIAIADTLAKFYALELGSERLMDCSGTNEEYLDVVEDIAAIDQLMKEIIEEIASEVVHSAESED